MSGGMTESVASAVGLSSKAQQMAALISKQYVVTYARPETLIPPQKIEVTVTKPGLKARARTRTGLAGAK